MWATLLHTGLPTRHRSTGHGGLTSREMLTLVRGVIPRGFAGMDIVEGKPTLDPTNFTSTAAVRIMDALAFHARAKW